MTTRVLADFHHEDLFYSLHLLFEERLGWELYRPIGLEWYQEGYWNVYPHPATAAQYLGLFQGTSWPEDTGCMNRQYVCEDGIYYVKDTVHDITGRAVTLEKFSSMDFDIVISSMPQHIHSFNRLIQQRQPKAKHIFQVGNAWGHQPGVANIMASTAPFHVPGDINIVFYHQEFKLDLFSYQPPTNHKLAHSYIHYMREPELLSQYRRELPDWTFKTYGAGMEDTIGPIKDMAEAYKRSGWTWHIKPEGDGYGYGCHRAFACGRPLIIKGRYYQGKLLGPMLEDSVNCIDLSQHSLQENLNLLRYYSQPELHLRICENAHKKFQDIVNFDAEEQKIRRFLSDLR